MPPARAEPRAIEAWRRQRRVDTQTSLHDAKGGPNLLQQLAVPVRAVGGFFEMSIDTARAAVGRPFQLGEFLEQTWMIARVSLVPTLLVSIPFTVLVAFTLNVLLREIGAADLSGAGTAIGTITQLGPVVTVLVVAGGPRARAGLPDSSSYLAGGRASMRASRNDRAQRSTSWASTWRRSARIRSRPSSTVWLSAASTASLTPSRSCGLTR